MIPDRDVLDGVRIVGFERGLQLRQIGDEPRHQQSSACARAELIDLRAGADDLALERGFRFFGDARADQVDRHPDAQHGEHRAGEKHAAAQRGQNLHRSVKSSSAVPPEDTIVLLGSEGVPSFQATTL